MPLLRFRVRTLMIAVALVAVLSFGEFSRRRWQSCHLLARYHGQEETRIRRILRGPVVAVYPDRLTTEEESEDFTAKTKARWLSAAVEHAKRKEMFERAAWRPWQAPPNDPPIVGVPKPKPTKPVAKSKKA